MDRKLSIWVILGVCALFVGGLIYAIGPELGWWDRYVSPEEKMQIAIAHKEADEKAAQNAAEAKLKASNDEYHRKQLAAMTPQDLADAAIKLFNDGAWVEGGDYEAELRGRTPPPTGLIKKVDRAIVKALQRQRDAFAEKLDSDLTHRGIEATVKADGQTLRVNSFVCGKVFLTDEFEQGHDILRAMKFKRITCNNGREFCIRIRGICDGACRGHALQRTAIPQREFKDPAAEGVLQKRIVELFERRHSQLSDQPASTTNIVTGTVNGFPVAPARCRRRCSTARPFSSVRLFTIFGSAFSPHPYRDRMARISGPSHAG
jgi:hypothetical protein